MYVNLLFAFVRTLRDLRFTNENICVCIPPDVCCAALCVLFANANTGLAFYHLRAQAVFLAIFPITARSCQIIQFSSRKTGVFASVNTNITTCLSYGCNTFTPLRLHTCNEGQKNRLAAFFRCSSLDFDPRLALFGAIGLYHFAGMPFFSKKV